MLSKTVENSGRKVRKTANYYVQIFDLRKLAVEIIVLVYTASLKPLGIQHRKIRDYVDLIANSFFIFVKVPPLNLTLPCDNLCKHALNLAVQ